MKKSLLLIATLAATACDRKAPASAAVAAPPRPDVVAQVGDEVITVGQLRDALAHRHAPATPEARAAVLDELIQFRSLVQVARQRGYDRDPEIMSQYDRLLAGKVLEQSRENAEPPGALPEQDLQEAYQKNIAAYNTPGRARGAMIFIEAPAGMDPGKRAEKKAAAQEVQGKCASSGADFRGLASQYSYDQETRYRGGEFGYLQEGAPDPELGQEISDALFRLKAPGDISEVVDTVRGFYVVKLIERNEARLKSFDEVKAQLQQKLSGKKAATALKDARVEATSNIAVKRFPANLP